MSVLRQLNVLGQMRLDVPHLRSVESSIAADFDVVAGRVQAGETALIVRGFSLANFGTGTAANSVQLNTADGIVYNMNATEAGTFLWVPADRDVETLNSATNSRVSGSFTASQTNFVGVDFTREADPTTSDLVQFLDPNTLLENAKSVPLGRVLDYRIVISTTPFSASPNVTPIAKITTDASNNVLSVQDARNIMWRLGTGGDFPNALSTYAWPQNRTEASSGTGLFAGGDKGIDSQKGWMDAVMTRLWELGGGENWYSPTADRNVYMARKPAPDVFSNGENFEWVSSNLHWKGLRIVFDNSNTVGAYYNTVNDQTGNTVGLTDLVNGECIYVDIVRTSNATVTAQKAAMQTLSVPTTPGSRFVLAWRTADNIYTRDSHLPVGSNFTPATEAALGAVRLSRNYLGVAASPAGSGGSPVVISETGGTITAYAGSNQTALTLAGDGTGYGLAVTAGGINVPASGGNVRVDSKITTGSAIPLNLGTNGATLWSIGATGVLSSTGGPYQIQGVAGPTASTHAANADWLRVVPPQNYVINGDMMFWQRATAGPNTTGLTLTTTGAYHADRWYAFIASGSGTNTHYRWSQPGGAGPSYAQLSRSSGLDTNVAARALVYELDKDWADYGSGQDNTPSSVYQIVQANQSLPITLQWTQLFGAGITGSLVVKVVTGTDIIDTYVGGYTSATVVYTSSNQISVGSGTQTVVLPAGTLATNVETMALVFEWTPTANPAAANETYSLKGVMLTVGYNATPIPLPNLAGRTHAGEVALCERYYEKSNGDMGLPPNGANGNYYTGPVLNVSTANLVQWPISPVQFRTRKRQNPVMSIWDLSGTPSSWTLDTVRGTSASSTTFGFTLVNTGGTVTPAVAGFSGGRWAADADYPL